MIAVIIFLIVVIGILGMNLKYKNRCIEDLELSKARMLRRKEDEIFEILLKLQEFTDFRKTYSKEVIRDYVNKKIELNSRIHNRKV